LAGSGQAETSGSRPRGSTETAKLARWKRGEVFSFHFLLSQHLANLLHLANMIHRIDLLDVPRVDVFKTKRIQTFAGKLGIVTGISEQLPHIGNALPDHAPNLAVQRISSQAFPENTAEKILLVQRRGHERRGNRACIVEQVHLFWLKLLLALALAPVPTEIRSIFSSPIGQCRQYGSVVAIKKS